MNIAVFTKNWLGDVVFQSPALRAIKKHFSDAHLIVITPARCAELLKHNPYVDEVIIHDDRGAGKNIFSQLRIWECVISFIPDITKAVRKPGANSWKTFVKIRWPRFVICPNCNSKKVPKKGIQCGRQYYGCKDCHGYFNVTTGTVFENSKLDFSEVVMMISLMKRGVPVKEIVRVLDRPKTTVYRNLREIRTAKDETTTRLIRRIKP